MTLKSDAAAKTNTQSRKHQVRPADQKRTGPQEIVPLSPGVLAALAEPYGATPAQILALQRVAGNQAVSRLIQAKLTVNPTGDPEEQEADRAAEQVVTESASRRVSEERRLGGQRPGVQRQEDEEEVQAKPAATITPLLQRQGEDANAEVQTQSAIQNPFTAGPEIENRLVASQGGGSPLPGDVRAFMEPRFGADFSGVRVHTGGEAVQMNRELSAQAFTHGQEIYLGANRYEPGTDAGKRLLAHELTHVVQQTGGSKLRCQVGPRPVQIQGGLSAGQIHRKTVNMYLDFVRIKRNKIKWGAILKSMFTQSKKKRAPEGELYGHWWTEIGDLKPDGWHPTESYGWWPRKGVEDLKSTFKGVEGALNQGEDQDPHHGEPGEQEFHPVMPVDDTKRYYEIRDDVAKGIKKFAQGYKGKWMWRFGWGKNCHTFQEKLMKAAGLKKGTALRWLNKPPKPVKVRKIEATGAKGGGEHEDPKRWPAGERFVIMATDKTFEVATGQPTNPLTEELVIESNTRVRVVVADDLTAVARCRIDRAGKVLYARLRDVLGEPPGAETGDTV